MKKSSIKDPRLPVEYNISKFESGSIGELSANGESTSAKDVTASSDSAGRVARKYQWKDWFGRPEEEAHLLRKPTDGVCFSLPSVSHDFKASERHSLFFPFSQPVRLIGNPL